MAEKGEDNSEKKLTDIVYTQNRYMYILYIKCRLYIYVVTESQLFMNVFRLVF